MKTDIFGHSIEVTDALRTLIEKKIARVAEHMPGHIMSAHVTLSGENHHKRHHHEAEVTIHLKKTEIHSKGEADDMYKAIDMMIHKLDTQVLKHKEKIQDHH